MQKSMISMSAIKVPWLSHLKEYVFSFNKISNLYLDPIFDENGHNKINWLYLLAHLKVDVN